MAGKTLGIIGGGVMGGATARAAARAIAHKKIPFLFSEVLISDPNPKKLKTVRFAGIKVVPNNIDVAKNSDVLVLAVKPFIIKDVLKEIQSAITKKHLIISIAAGIPLKQLASLPTMHLARAMPNTPAQINMGLCGFFATRTCTMQDKKTIKELFSSCGMVTELPSENAVNAFGALAGSGPGYTFAFLEAFAHAARELGFSRDTSRTIALQTVLGAAHLAEENGLPFSELREEVATKGGITEAAFKVLFEKRWQEIFISAVKKALRRTKQLSGNRKS